MRSPHQSSGERQKSAAVGNSSGKDVLPYQRQRNYVLDQIYFFISKKFPLSVILEKTISTFCFYSPIRRYFFFRHCQSRPHIVCLIYTPSRVLHYVNSSRHLPSPQMPSECRGIFRNPLGCAVLDMYSACVAQVEREREKREREKLKEKRGRIRVTMNQFRVHADAHTDIDAPLGSLAIATAARRRCRCPRTPPKTPLALPSFPD